MMLPRLGRRAAAPAGQFARGRHIRVDGRLIVYLVTAMGLNIKYDETCQLACELTRLTGDTMTGAITIALRERLEQSVESGERKKRLRDMRAIANAVFAYWSLAPPAIKHGHVLYEDRGLPRLTVEAAQGTLDALVRFPSACRGRYVIGGASACRCFARRRAVCACRTFTYVNPFGIYVWPCSRISCRSGLE